MPEMSIEDCSSGELGPDATAAAGRSGWEKARPLRFRFRYLDRYGPLPRPLNVIGTDDDRVHVAKTQQLPWRYICHLEITASDDALLYGTGWLVGPGTVATAAHCVYSHEHGGEVRSIKVFPGRAGVAKTAAEQSKKEPYGSCSASEFRYPDEWKNSGSFAHDYGAIILPAADCYGTDLGYLGFADLRGEDLRRLKVNLSGYPIDRELGTQWWNARRLGPVTETSLGYDIDTEEGHSGSPVWWLENGVRRVVGIHHYGADAGNRAVRINDAAFQHLRAWKEEGRR